MLFLTFFSFPDITRKPTYENRRQEIWVTPDEEYVDFLMEHMLPREEITRAHADKIKSWLQKHQNQEGKLLEISDSS